MCFAPARSYDRLTFTLERDLPVRLEPTDTAILRSILAWRFRNHRLIVRLAARS